MTRPVPIPEARRLANATGATRMMILSLDDAGNYALTTFGFTGRALNEVLTWADDRAEVLAVAMDMGCEP